MRQYSYEGTDRNGRLIRGSTSGESAREVKAQLATFGFKNVRVTEEASIPAGSATSEAAAPDDLVQRLVDGDIEIDASAAGGGVGEEEEEDEWFRAEALAKIRKHRRRENIALVITLTVLGAIAAYYIYDKLTEIPAPQPHIIMRNANEMLSFKDVYVKGDDLIFIVFAPRWNGNVRVDYQAWDVLDNRIDFGTARLGFIGSYYGGSPEKSGAVKLKKHRFYNRIEILVSGDEGK
jgi:hypothetical protein